MINLEVEDISGSGISVQEYQEDSVLLIGLIIPELIIEFANNFTIKCKAQVVYRNDGITDDDKPQVKCGIAFLGMDMQDQSKLASLLHKVIDKKILRFPHSGLGCLMGILF